MSTTSSDQRTSSCSASLQSSSFSVGRVVVNHLDAYPKSVNSDKVIRLNDLFFANYEHGHPKVSEVEGGIFLTFCYQMEMLAPLIAAKAKIVIASNSKNEFLTKKEPKPTPNVSIHMISRFIKNINATFHPKLYLLKFPSFLRVVVGSGNLLPDDWTDFGNIFYVRDYPLHPSGKQTKNPQKIQFLNYLRCYLEEVFQKEHSSILEQVGIDLLSYNMEDETALLIGSVPGYSKIDDLCPHGIPLLTKQMREHHTKVPHLKDLRITFLTSSLGSLNLYFLLNIARALVPEFPWTKKDLKGLSEKQKKEFLDIFHIVFPTQDYINKATDNTDCLFFRRSAYEGFSFEKSVMSSYEGSGSIEGNDTIVPHYKAIIVTFSSDFAIRDDTIIYLGSHNLTKAAWGKPANFDADYCVWNFELGVVFPNLKKSSEFKKEVIETLGVEFPPSRMADFEEPFFSDPWS